MGEVVGAGLLAHVPTIVLPEETRRELNNGEDSSLVAGLHQLRREVFDVLDYDTVVVLDAHWATTVEFVVSAQDRRQGLFTSEELPRGMSQRPYDFPGDRELAHLIAAQADRHGTWITAIEDDHLPIFYATTNLWEFLGQGLPDKRWISIGVCQTADTEDNLRLGRALGDAIAASDRKVVLIASGALSHTFWPLRQLRAHEAAGVEHIFTPEAAAADFERIEWFGRGDHARVLATMPEFYRFKPEARFGHYLMMIGALGEGDCTAAGRLYGRYENSVGTGQVHLWFDRPEGGFPAAHATQLDAVPVPPVPGPRRIWIMTEYRRILLDGSVLNVVRDGDRLVAGDGRSVDVEQAVHLPPVVPSKILAVHLKLRLAGAGVPDPAAVGADLLPEADVVPERAPGGRGPPRTVQMAELRGRDRDRDRPDLPERVAGAGRRLHRRLHDRE
jgi:3,4-dihydroxyphenylacetate 2,3-dioxygenase